MKARCAVCYKEVDKLLYWRDPKFHPDQLTTIFFCGPGCSLKYEEKRKNITR